MQRRPPNLEALYFVQELVDDGAPQVAETEQARCACRTLFPFLSVTMAVLAMCGSGLLRLEPSQVLLIP